MGTRRETGREVERRGVVEQQGVAVRATLQQRLHDFGLKWGHAAAYRGASTRQRERDGGRGRGDSAWTRCAAGWAASLIGGPGVCVLKGAGGYAWLVSVAVCRGRPPWLFVASTLAPAVQSFFTASTWQGQFMRCRCPKLLSFRAKISTRRMSQPLRFRTCMRSEVVCAVASRPRLFVRRPRTLGRRRSGSSTNNIGRNRSSSTAADGGRAAARR